MIDELQLGEEDAPMSMAAFLKVSSGTVVV